MVNMATGQNSNTETVTEMALVKTATNPNNTYSSSYFGLVAVLVCRRFDDTPGGIPPHYVSVFD